MDERKVSSKPDGLYKSTITKHLTKRRCFTIHEFARNVTQPYGYTWSGGLFNGMRSNATWESQQVFGLDFDKGTILAEEVVDTINQFGFKPQLYYTTFSDSASLPKFRVIFFLGLPITDIRLHKMVYDAFISLFPDVDKSCKDASRYFYGGKEFTLIHTNPISTSQFLDALSIQLYTTDSCKFRSLPLNAGYYKNPVEKCTFQYYYYCNIRFQTDLKTFSPPTTTLTGLVSLDIRKARKQVKILDEFLNGTWLFHMQLFGLATNMVRIRGGYQLMKKTMEKFNVEGKTRYTPNNFSILPYVKKVGYPMMPVYKFSPYPEDIDLYDIISTTRNIRGMIEYTPIPWMSLNDAEKLLDETFIEVKENGEAGKIYLISMPTALGKTEKLLGAQATIALPTNTLKNEIAERFRYSSYSCHDFKFTTTPDTVVFESVELNLKQQYYYTIGLPTKSMRLLHHIVKNEHSGEYSIDDVMLARGYLTFLEECRKTQNTVVTTHKRALFTEFKNDTLIFDEDPLSSLLEIKKLKISDLFLLNQTLNDPELAHLIDFLNKATPLQIEPTPTFNINVDHLISKLSQAELESNVFEFFGSSFFMRDCSSTPQKKDKKLDTIHYIVRKDLPGDKKIIIMSATIPVALYRMLFGDRVVVHEIKNVQQQGRIVQYTQKSCSRSGLKKYGHVISKTVGDKQVITFKGMRSLFKNPVEGIWFGNCSGYDGLKGQDLVIVGTPHRNPLQYLLLAKVCGIKFNTTDTTMSYQKVEYNGYRFMMKCYDNEALRSIQLSLIESDLVQAVGRARTLRTDATVEVYSSFPLSISDEFVY